ncbi:hypothetical protein O181_126334 [Austropuccinia psidii MF-1]|uniref:Uncharacterized protein n=1 Tax=Austropuccinia psidii MF-1 TaxID=1389203 RepID=A0A9Q3KT47_9BASI|nr:hypothetical protein [Austropuccinia psidii MF-1]
MWSYIKGSQKYEPDSHIPRHSTHLASGNISMKESMAPFSGGNPISEKDIPKLYIQEYRGNKRIFHIAENIHKNFNWLRRWALANAPLEEKPHIPIEEINIPDLGTEIFEEVRESYQKEKKLYILTLNILIV